MVKNKFQKVILLTFALALAGAMVPCTAANLVPFNGGNVVVPPSVPVTKSIVKSKNPSGSFSVQSMKSKIGDIIKPKRSNLKQSTVSGTCGTNCNWTLDTSTGELIISGTGKMESHPWTDSYKDDIKSVTIGNGTTIGGFTFSGCRALTTIDIPDSVTTIGNTAFYGCSSLSHVCYLGTNDPGKSSSSVFGSCSKLSFAAVTNKYEDNSFCGISVMNAGETCVADKSSSVVASSSDKGSSSSAKESSSVVASSSVKDSSSTKPDPDPTPVASSSTKPEPTPATSSTNPEESAETSSASSILQSTNWFVKAAAWLAPVALLLLL